MIGAQVEVGGGDGSDAPVGAGVEGLLLVHRRCRDRHLVAVMCGCGCGCKS